MVHSYYGAMFSMQTKPEYRRKGFGIHLARTLTQRVIERGYKPFVVIRPENEASRNLYTKLGFEKAFETCRVKLTPRIRQNDDLNEKDISNILANKLNLNNDEQDDEAKVPANDSETEKS
uniref:N-acetyltransferase domain-containing protein n=1 Tax=Megaselia scalaris TaxID=36166 RepID=T1GU27_MEGSC